jgi:hypothetical protein
MKKNSAFFIIFFMLFFSCNKADKKPYSYQPQFYTKLDLTNIEKITLIKYKKKQKVNESLVEFDYKYRVDDFPYTKDSIAWNFTLKDSFSVGEDYKLIFQKGDKKYFYTIKNISYDSVPSGKKRIYIVKYYDINNKKHSIFMPEFYLDE